MHNCERRSSLERNEKAIEFNRNDCNLRGTAKVFICRDFHLKKLACCRAFSTWGKWKYSAPSTSVFINDKTHVFRALPLIKRERHVVNFLCRVQVNVGIIFNGKSLVSNCHLLSFLFCMSTRVFSVFLNEIPRSRS